jgi:hypothetical protein
VVIHLIAFLYALFFIKESPAPSKIPENTKVNFFADFFDPTNAIETFRIGFKRGRRLKIAVLLIVVVVVVGPMHGEQSVMYLYTRLRFNWNEVDYSIYQTFATLVTMSGGFFF